MEIERKFLIKERNKEYPSEFNIKKLKQEIIKSGKKITQSYLSKKLIPNVLKKLKNEINFKPSQLRIRKYNNKYFLTIKSSGGLSREEFEIKISKDYYNELLPLRKKYIKKIRLRKKFKGHMLDIDYYPKYDLLIIEIEFKTVKLANNFETIMKDITLKKKYGNENLATK